ncbi:hypothetical protein BCR44DRAFT_1423929 [Catenaria anguillulae PL171]|uniref:Uncharacterized protein n=1 Tax=Catenaria anguillulae PL171 TaxID=765915 RepID=A0A1Y2I4G2_9FUNG|nr:hypothetical protein BCR44DRAFT_1423929 [Catenaria anguillulae PL171]
MTFRFRKGGDLHADLQWAVHSLTWLATWCLLPLAYFDAEALSGRVWAAHAAGAGLGGSGTLSGPASVWAARLDASGRVEPETSSVRQLSAGVRQRYVTAPAHQNPVNPPPMPRPPPTQTLGTLVPIYALTLVFFTLVPYSLFASVTQILLIGYALITLAPLGVKLGLRPVVATLANPDAAFHAAVDAAKAECERLEAAISVVDVRIMAAESEVGIGRVLRERAEEDKRERPCLGAEEMVSDLLPTRAQEGAGHPGNGAGTKPRLPKLIISTESSKHQAARAGQRHGCRRTRGHPSALAHYRHLLVAISSAPTHGNPHLAHLAHGVGRSHRPHSPAHHAALCHQSIRVVPALACLLCTQTHRVVARHAANGVAVVVVAMPLDSRSARRVRDMHRSRTKLLAAHANALAALAHIPVRFAYRRGWMARTCAGCALPCSLGLGTCYAASLFCASSVLAMLIVRGLVATVVGDRAPVVVVVCGALGEAVEVIVLGPWVACGRLGGSDTWLGKVVVPAVLVGGFG